MSTRSVPSGTRIIRAITPITPTSYRSWGAGVSISGLRPATIAIVRSPRSASLISSMLRSWPMLSGISISGNVTVSRRGSTPTCARERAGTVDGHVAPAGVRDADLDHRCEEDSLRMGTEWTCVSV